MTCIVGLEDNGDVYIGGDSAGIAGYSLSVRADEKVFRNGEFLMGFTSSFRMGQLLRYKLDPPERLQSEDVDKFMVVRFIDAIRACLKSGGYAKKENEVEQAGTFLVGYQGSLFQVESDYQVGKARLPFSAVGCGEDIALGSMFSTAGHPAMTPEERIILALESAERFSAGVRRPFVVLKMDSKETT